MTMPLMAPDRRLAAQAYEQLLDLIMSGALKPGTMIHERRLAEHLNMSRTPLRDALLLLERDGLVSRHGRSGLSTGRGKQGDDRRHDIHESSRNRLD